MPTNFLKIKNSVQSPDFYFYNIDELNWLQTKKSQVIKNRETQSLILLACWVWGDPHISHMRNEPWDLPAIQCTLLIWQEKTSYQKMHEFYYASPKEIQEFSFYLILIVCLSNDNIKLQVKFYIHQFLLFEKCF